MKSANSWPSYLAANCVLLAPARIGPPPPPDQIGAWRPAARVIRRRQGDNLVGQVAAATPAGFGLAPRGLVAPNQRLALVLARARAPPPPGPVRRYVNNRDQTIGARLSGIGPARPSPAPTTGRHARATLFMSLARYENGPALARASLRWARIRPGPAGETGPAGRRL